MQHTILSNSKDAELLGDYFYLQLPFWVEGQCCTGCWRTDLHYCDRLESCRKSHLSLPLSQSFVTFPDEPITVANYTDSGGADL